MGIVKERVTNLFFYTIQGFAFFILMIIPLQATDFFDDRQEPRRVCAYRWDATIQDEPTDTLLPSLIKPSMPGKVVKLLVHEGQEIKEGERLCILEAMKIEVPIEAPFSGYIQSIFFTIGDDVHQGSSLVLLLPPGTIPFPLNAPPPNKAEEAKAPITRKDEAINHATQSPQIASFSSPSSLFKENPIPYLIPSALETIFSASFSSFIFPEIAKTIFDPLNNPPTPPLKEVNVPKSQKESTARTRPQPSALVVQRPTRLAFSLKRESLSLKKGSNEEIEHSSHGSPFCQKLPAIQDVLDCSFIITCTKWMGGLMAITQFLLALKAMVYYILRRPYARRFSFMICPLPEITFLRSADFIKHPFMANQLAHNMNRIRGKRLNSSAHHGHILNLSSLAAHSATKKCHVA